MTSGIQGPGGPRGPGGLEGPGEVGATGAAGGAVAAEVERLRAAGEAEAVGDLAAIAAELDAGRITGDEAIARLIAGVGGAAGEPGSVDAAELRALLADLVEADPYLAELARRLGGGTG